MPGSRVELLGTPGQPVPPVGDLRRYARVGEGATVAIVEERLIFNVRRFGVWASIDDNWHWCGFDFNEAEARQRAEHVAITLQGKTA